MPMALAILREGGEPGDIQPVITVPVELNRSAADQQIGHRGVTITDRLTKVRERLTEILASTSFRFIGPQEPGQSVPAMRMICFNSQIGK